MRGMVARYEAVNEDVLVRVPAGCRRVLDVGCGTGGLGARLKRARGCEVVGITGSGEEASEASGALDRVVCADLEDFEPASLGTFDCIVCSHVLEHLRRPEGLLRRLRECLTPAGLLLAALPNALFWRQRIAFLLGRFRYTEGGLMDRGHLRFFDPATSRTLLEDGGFRVIRWEAQGHAPLPGLRAAAPGLAARIDGLAVRAFPGLFGTQFLLGALKN